VNVTRVALLAVLGLSAALNLTSIGYQQPSHWDPAIDGVHPALALDAWNNKFGERMQVSLKYPRAHLLLAGAAEKVWLSLRFGFEDGPARHDALMEAYQLPPSDRMIDRREALAPHAETIAATIEAGRFLSALFGTLAVLGLFLLTRELFGVATAAVAGMAAAVSYPLVYYSHTLNVDAPYLGWSMLALYFVARAVRSGAGRPLVVGAVCVAFAGATKDQAFGLFLLFAPLALFLRARPAALAQDVGPRSVGWSDAGKAVAISLLVYLALIGLPFDVAGVRTHFDHIFGDGVKPFREHPGTLAGQWGLLRDSVLSLLAMLGPVWSVLAVIGAFGLAVRRPRKAVLVLAPAAAYYFTFIAPIGYVYMRFLMPIALLALVPAAALVVAASRVRALRWVAPFAVVAALAIEMQRSIGLVTLLRDDPRPKATAWLDKNVEEGARLVSVLELPLHNLEIPAKVEHFQINAARPLDATPENVPAWCVISTFDEFRSLRDPSPAPPSPPPELKLLGVDFERVVEFGPAAPHPIRRGAKFQPTIGIYRRR